MSSSQHMIMGGVTGTFYGRRCTVSFVISSGISEDLQTPRNKLRTPAAFAAQVTHCFIVKNKHCFDEGVQNECLLRFENKANIFWCEWLQKRPQTMILRLT